MTRGGEGIYRGTFTAAKTWTKKKEVLHNEGAVMEFHGGWTG